MNRIAELRRSKGWTQSDLGILVKVTSATVSKWERGSQGPAAKARARLASKLGVSVEDLRLDGVVEHPAVVGWAAEDEVSAALDPRDHTGTHTCDGSCRR